MFKIVIALFFFATVVLGQSIDIGLPVANQSVSLGSDIIVQIQRPDTLTGSVELAVVIGLQPCRNKACIPTSEYLDIVLYSGSYDPQFHEYYLPPYENFTVQVPSTTPTGSGVIGVAHFALVGAGNFPLFEILNQTITIVRGEC